MTGLDRNKYELSDLVSVIKYNAGRRVKRIFTFFQPFSTTDIKVFKKYLKRNGYILNEKIDIFQIEYA